MVRLISEDVANEVALELHGRSFGAALHVYCRLMRLSGEKVIQNGHNAIVQASGYLVQLENGLSTAELRSKAVLQDGSIVKDVCAHPINKAIFNKYTVAYVLP
jgi:hypothetical protein